jgi:hypothetical protein
MGRMWETGNTYRILVWKLFGKLPLGRFRRRRITNYKVWLACFPLDPRFAVSDPAETMDFYGR